MDILSFVGVFLAFSMILLGQTLEGGHISSLINLPAAMIVLGGTLGAVMLETPWSTFLRSMKVIKWVFFPPKIDFNEEIEKIISWAVIARKQGLLGLEAVIENEADLYIQNGLRLLVDGGDPKAIRSIMNLELMSRWKHDQHAAMVYESMGGYSPTIGIIGAVLGLIHVMGNLSDPSRLGPGIAVAFVATIYGVALANVLFLPIGTKLQKYILIQKKLDEMIMEGIIAISHGENPRVTRLKLQGYA